MFSRIRWVTHRGLFLAALVLVLPPLAAEEWVVNGEHGFYAKRPPELTLAPDGTPVVAFYDGEGHILVCRKGQAPTVLNEDSKSGNPSGLALATLGEDMIAVWRERRKQGQTLVSRRSSDGGATWENTRLIDWETQPLTRIRIARDAAGNLHVLWLGQRLDELAEPIPADPEEGGEIARSKRRQSYHVYATLSEDRGRTWSKPVKLTEGYADSIWPTLLIHKERAYSFSASIKGGKRHMMVRWRDSSESWSTPLHIKEVGETLLIRPVALHNGVMVLWLAAYKGYYLLEGAIFRDNGKRWRTFAIDKTKTLDIGNLETAVQGENINIVFSARLHQQGGDRKQSIYLLRSINGGREWEKLRVLRHDPHPRTQSLYPRVLADGKNTIAVWNDFRNFRGDAYLNYSTDSGKTWLPEDIPLESRGYKNSYLFPFAQALGQHEGVYYLLIGRYPNDSFASDVDLVLLRFNRGVPYPERSLLDDAGSEKKTKMLRERAELLWKSLIQGDYESVYRHFDPFFRGRFRKIDYLAATGMIKYHAYEIESVQVQGNLGQVTLRYTYEIPTLTTRLGSVARPPTEAKVTGTWLFIDGDWHKEYRSESSGTVYGRY